MAVDFADPLGADVKLLNDLDVASRWVSGTGVVRQDILHRLTTRRGALLEDPDFGLDLKGLLNAVLPPSEFAALPGQVEAEVRKDERVDSVDVRITRSAESGPAEWEIALTLGTASGPFELILSVSNARVKILGES